MSQWDEAEAAFYSQTMPTFLKGVFVAGSEKPKRRSRRPSPSGKGDNRDD